MVDRSRGTPPHLEVQIHPADIRRGVRTFFLTRKQVRLLGICLVVYLAFLATGLALAPRVLSSLFFQRAYSQQLVQRSAHGEELQRLVRQLTELDWQSDHVHLLMSRIFLAYGLPPVEGAGEGGYPFLAAETPDSIYSSAIRQGGLIEARVAEQLRVLETFYEEVAAFERENRERVALTPAVTPLASDRFVLTSAFGNRRSPFTKQLQFHSGIDMAAATGTPVHAPARGVVAFAGRYPLRESVAWWRYGNIVALRHGDHFVTIYGHCHEVRVRRGQEVQQGEVIATVGNTGWSTSPHLHYEVRRRTSEGEYEPVDPRIYMLDHRWRDEERILVRARVAPELRNFEPLPRLISR